MSKNTPIPLVIEFDPIPRYYLTPMAWNIKDSGEPTSENIEKFIRVFIDSQKVGQPNFGIAPIILVPNGAKVYRQTKKFGKKLVAEWTAPMFMVI